MTYLCEDSGARADRPMTGAPGKRMLVGSEYSNPTPWEDAGSAPGTRQFRRSRRGGRTVRRRDLGQRANGWKSEPAWNTTELLGRIAGCAQRLGHLGPEPTVISETPRICSRGERTVFNRAAVVTAISSTADAREVAAGLSGPGDARRLLRFAGVCRQRCWQETLRTVVPGTWR